MADTSVSVDALDLEALRIAMKAPVFKYYADVLMNSAPPSSREAIEYCFKQLLPALQSGNVDLVPANPWRSVSNELPPLEQSDLLLDTLCSVELLVKMKSGKIVLAQAQKDLDEGIITWRTTCSEGWNISKHVEFWKFFNES